MQNIFKSLILLLIVSPAIYASVTAKVDSTTVELGEMVTYSLDVSGEKIKRPNIKRLCESDVISTSSQTSIQVVNGDFKKNYILSYKFVPQKSCKIEPLEIEIDGKKEFSNAIEIKVAPVTGAKDLNFILTLSSDKKELFVGESFDLTLTLKQKADFGAVDSEFTPPELNGFWVKSESEPLRTQDGKYTTTKITYTMAPQRAGKAKITKAKMRIASRSNRADSWGAWIPTIKWKTYFSNELELDVKPLPAGVDLVGDFTIKATVDKSEINANEAVNVKIEVVGSGNLEDIKSFKPYIDGVSVFDEKIVVEGIKLTQNIAFVAERDFSIPSFILKYFDPKTQEIKTISSDDIGIKVKNQKAKEELIIKREETAAPQDNTKSDAEYSKYVLIVTFLIGLISGILIMLIKPFRISKRERSASIKDPRVLLVRLLPFKDDEEVQKIVEKLEDSIYSNKKLELDKKVLKELLKKYEID